MTYVQKLNVSSLSHGYLNFLSLIAKCIHTDSKIDAYNRCAFGNILLDLKVVV